MRLDGKELLRTEDICLTFHPEDGIPVKAADHVSITIHEGETFGLVGESGSGKSTLARILTHIHQPDSGKVYFEGKDVTNLKGKALRESRRAIQMAYNQEHGIVPRTIVKAIADSIEISDKAENAKRNTRRMGKMEREAAIERLTREMKEAAKLLEFEHAAFLRDQIDRLRRGENPTVDSAAETERKQNHAQTQRKGRKYLGKR